MVMEPLASLRETLGQRSEYSKKGDFGRLLVIGGSKSYTGAPTLVAIAALRSGCDLVTVSAPQRSADITAGFSPDLITCPQRCERFGISQVKRIAELTHDFDAVVLGNGLGKHTDTRGFVNGLLARSRKPCVIDADALVMLSEETCLPEKTILTPHQGEYFLMTGEKAAIEIRKRSIQARGLAKRMGCTVLLKGGTDIVTDGHSVLKNEAGSPFMTKGGTGDTLAGICGAMLAMNMEPIDAAFCGARINGIAGELAAKRLGPGMLASDVVRSIPDALISLQSGAF